MDVSGDGVADMVYHTDTSGRLLFRKGIAASGGGTDINSLASAANSADKIDTVYGASGWYTTDVPLLMGTTDANSDGIPDIWAVAANRAVKFHPGGRTTLSGSGTQVINPNTYWPTRLSIG